METGSFRVIGGAVKETYALYKRLSEDGYRIDLMGNYQAVDSSAVAVDTASAMARDYDIVWMNSIRDVPVAKRYSKAHRNAKIVFVDRGNIISNLKKESGIAALRPKSIARRLLAGSLRNWLDHYVALSAGQLPDAQSFFSGKTGISCIPIAPHKEYRKLRIRKTFQGGIAASRLEESQKRISFMIKGILRMKHIYPDIGDNTVLKIVGTGPDEASYASLAKSLGISKNISFKGFESGEQLVREFNNSGFFVSTSSWESFGRSLIEAMACGLPALINPDINTTVSENPRRALVRHGYNGMIYSSGNINDFAEKFHMLYSNAWMRSRMSANALKSIKGFSFSVVARSYEKLIDSM